MKIILDTMGSDNGVRAATEGAILAVEKYGVEMILVGNEPEIMAVLETNGQAKNEKLRVVHASEIVDMHDDAATVLREKKDSSMARAFELLKSGEGDAIVGAGNTGAFLSGATLLIKRIQGIRRAALAPVLPTAKGGAVLVDCGANAECTPEYLLQFAIMGSIYAQRQMKIKSPRVGLANNGAEDTKGTPLYREAHALLKEAHAQGKINFIGNVEGRDIPLGSADVVVCDGFVGNLILKTIEGTAMYLVDEIKSMFMQSTKTKIAALLMKPSLKEFKKKLDYTEVGGAPLLGISKPVVKAHGSSNAKAFCGAIGQAMIYAGSGIVDEIEKNIEQK